MMNTNTHYQLIRPENFFHIDIIRTRVEDTPLRAHYEYGVKITCRETANDFINHFARLVCAKGKMTARLYARLLGVSDLHLRGALQVLSGASVDEWTDAFVRPLCEKLLLETDWPIIKVAKTATFRSNTSFSEYFHKRYKCYPRWWRWHKGVNVPPSPDLKEIKRLEKERLIK